VRGRDALTRPGGEPLQNVPKDLAIFSPLRGRPNTVLNGRLPKTTARAVLSILVFGGRSSAQRANNLPRVETFPGAACSTKFAIRHAPRQISRVLLATIQSGLPDVASRSLDD
jgi:hypothetical protein